MDELRYLRGLDQIWLYVQKLGKKLPKDPKGKQILEKVIKWFASLVDPEEEVALAALIVRNLGLEQDFRGFDIQGKLMFEVEKIRKDSKSRKLT